MNDEPGRRWCARASLSFTITSSARSGCDRRPRSTIGRSIVCSASTLAAPNTAVVGSNFDGSVLMKRYGSCIHRATCGNDNTRPATCGVVAKNTVASSGRLYARNLGIAVCERRAPAAAVNATPQPHATISDIAITARHDVRNSARTRNRTAITYMIRPRSANGAKVARLPRDWVCQPPEDGAALLERAMTGCVARQDRGRPLWPRSRFRLRSRVTRSSPNSTDGAAAVRATPRSSPRP